LAERFAEVDVVLDREIEAARRAPAHDLDVVGFVDLPTGTLSCGRLGISRDEGVEFLEQFAERASLASVRLFRPATSAITAEASSPLPLSMPICLDRLLRLACNPGCASAASCAHFRASGSRRVERVAARGEPFGDGIDVVAQQLDISMHFQSLRS
jgi:hypothetical protein